MPVTVQFRAEDNTDSWSPYITVPTGEQVLKERSAQGQNSNTPHSKHFHREPSSSPKGQVQEGSSGIARTGYTLGRGQLRSEKNCPLLHVPPRPHSPENMHF